MNVLKNVGEYINIHLFGYRYDYEIIKYFNDPYRKAILTLYKEGYPVKDEYDRLLDEYKTINGHLNLEELNYCLKYINPSNSNLDLVEIIELRRKIAHGNIFLLSLDTKYKTLAFEYKSQYNLLSLQSEILSKEIKKINPVFNAVLIRKLVKLIEEKLIYSYINYFDEENYIPKIDLLIKYKERINTFLLDKDDKNIKIKIDKEILNLKKKNSINIKDEKNKPKIIYLVNNKITQIHKVLNIIRTHCNTIIHFDPNKEVEFNLDESLLDKINTPEYTNKKKNLLNEIYFGNKKIKNNDKNYFIEITKAANYIAYSDKSNELLDKLIKLKNDFEDQLNSTKNLLNKDKNYKAIDKLDLYNYSKNDILEDYSFVEDLMAKLKVPKFIEGLTKKEVKKIIKYINSNKYDYKEINIENCTKEEDLILIKINNELKKMDIYSRIKFNLTFERDIKIIEFYNELKSYKASIESIDNYNKIIDEFKAKFIKSYLKLKEEYKLINDCIIVFDISKIFHEISKKEFVEFISNQFGGVKIDLFEKEINNIFLYIFLLKKNIYNEIAFKTTEGINDE